MTPRAALVQELAQQRAHVLRTVEGLGEDDLERPAARSGWTPRSMLNHLRYDDELFWMQAVLGAEEQAIGRLRDGWTVPSLPGAELREGYRQEIARSDLVLERTDLDAPPAWWPPPSMLDGPRFSSGWQVLLRVLSETAVHAGHLDMAREAIDGHQDLVVRP